jgi:hypothetical protein
VGERRALLNETSLAETVAAVEDAHFFNRKPTPTSAQAVMRWLDTRQAIGKGYQRALCTPTDADKKDGARVFTGERLGTGAQTLHVLGEEAYRSYLLLSKWTDSSLTLTVETMGAAMGERLDQHYNGRYCCGPCSVSVWRALIAGGYSKNEERLELAMKYLHSKRDASGRWGNLPFFYTVLTLSEMETPTAKDELHYCLPTCDQLLKRYSTITEPYASRRTALLERVLSRD